MELERLVKMRKTVKKGILTIWRRMRNDYFKDHKGQVCVCVCVCVLHPCMCASELHMTIVVAVVYELFLRFKDSH